MNSLPTEILKERADIVHLAVALKVVDQESYDEAARSLSEAGYIEKKIVEFYEPLRVATKDAYDAVLASKKRDIEPILEVKAILSKGVAAYSLEQERLLREAQRKADDEAAAEAQKKKDETIAKAKEAGAPKQEIKAIERSVVTFTSPTVDPTHRQSKLVSKPIERWHAQVLGDEGFMLLVKAVAEGRVHPVLVLPNEKALNKMAATFKDKMNIPGVKAVCDYTTSVWSTSKGG